jgi:predicted MarR family transcription regulator
LRFHVNNTPSSSNVIRNRFRTANSFLPVFAVSRSLFFQPRFARELAVFRNVEHTDEIGFWQAFFQVRVRGPTRRRRPMEERRASQNPVLQDDAYMTSTPGELALVRMFESFARWATELTDEVSHGNLTYEDAAVLHCLRLRRGMRNLSELLMFMNRSDVSNLQYSLRKLERAGLVRRLRGESKRESSYVLTDHGKEVTDRYGVVREAMLVRLTADVVGFDSQMIAASTVLERMVGLYDQATQSVLNQRITGFKEFMPKPLSPVLIKTEKT